MALWSRFWGHTEFGEMGGSASSGLRAQGRKKVILMQFGLFCSPKADAPGFAAETGQGFRDFLDFNIEAEALGFSSSFSVEHHFSGWNQSSATLMLLMALAMRTSTLRLGT